MAFVIDFLIVWLISSTLGSNNTDIQFVTIFIFILAWLISRVIIPYNNHGQSLGKWAVNIQILEIQDTRIPTLTSLLTREVIVCLGALLIAIALSNTNSKKFATDRAFKMKS